MVPTVPVSGSGSVPTHHAQSGKDGLSQIVTQDCPGLLPLRSTRRKMTLLIVNVSVKNAVKSW